MSEGWKCPNCGKAHGPHIDTCPEAERDHFRYAPSVFPREGMTAPARPVFQDDTIHWPPYLPTVTC